jgi:hypothetical protein
MNRNYASLFVLITLLIVVPVGSVSAEDMPSLDLPPGVAAQAQPHLEAMMRHMQASGMTHDQMKTMMADMQKVVDQLPPGIFLQILELVSQLDMDERMALHREMHQGNLLQQPPGKILAFVRDLAQ